MPSPTMTSPGRSGAPPHAVVIGAGAAGSVTAYRLRHLLGPDASITVLEGSGHVGGRARNISFGGTRLEVGASILHSRGRRLLSLAQAVRIPISPVAERPTAVAVWNGARFTLNAPAGGLEPELVARYGQENVLRLAAVARNVASAWSTVYRLQDRGALFENPGQMLRAVSLGSLPDVSLADRLLDADVDTPIIDGFVTGILRNIYNQTPAVNAFAGSIALIGAGLAGGTLFAARDGNSRLFERVVTAANARLLLETRAASVHATPRGYAVTTTDGAELAADTVVVAAAPELAHIEFDPAVQPDHRPFQTVHVTLVAGQASARFFGANTMPDTVFTEDDPALRFTSFATAAFSPQHRAPIWKIFSAEAVGDAGLAEMFDAVHEVWRGSWSAYPVLTPRRPMPSFELAPGLYCVNAMESAASTMEHEAVAAWNVAGLVQRHLARR
ncbi:hypothetical protein Pth03_11270 [Planotetraspora thailandica]|uniref:Prenylcysteine lyase domain-containing protein n=1 Tax=Planotetraspora thailandica TaxID=487172 RepID=A0A8J3UVI4_9ACTN|nr:prenylcysteine lyase family protein [Planotetraspora thailandica]GII52738.1 hypothetical protein Pth03_11270 [Planotetraspora thailandica]